MCSLIKDCAANTPRYLYIELRVWRTNDFNELKIDHVRSLLIRAFIIVSHAYTHVTIQRSREPHNRRRNYTSVKETNDPSIILSPLSCYPPLSRVVHDSSPSLLREMALVPKAGGDAPATGFRSRSRLSGRAAHSARTVVNTVRNRPGDVLTLPGSPVENYRRRYRRRESRYVARDLFSHSCKLISKSKTIELAFETF